MTATVTQLRPAARHNPAHGCVNAGIMHVDWAMEDPEHASKLLPYARHNIDRAREYLADEASAVQITLPVLANHVVQALCRTVWPELDDEAPNPLLGARAALRAALAHAERRDWLSAHRMLAVATTFLELALEGLHP